MNEKETPLIQFRDIVAVRKDLLSLHRVLAVNIGSVVTDFRGLNRRSRVADATQFFLRVPLLLSQFLTRSDFPHPLQPHPNKGWIVFPISQFNLERSRIPLRLGAHPEG